MKLEVLSLQFGDFFRPLGQDIVNTKCLKIIGP
jgi:hypothetical protein